MSRRLPLPYLEQEAILSPDGQYRYLLSRRLALGDRTVLWVGLNPSTADALVDDPTIRREVAFSRLWGFDRYFKVNLYAYRSTDPQGLRTVADPVGPANAPTIRRLLAHADIVVAAWGQFRVLGVAADIARLVLLHPHTLCLGVNQDGSPKHPLYLKRTTVLQDVP